MSNKVSKSKSGAWVARNLVFIFGVGLLIIAAIMFYTQVPSKTAEIQRQTTMIEELEQGQSGSLSVAEVQEVNEAVSVATGMSLDRQIRDAKNAEDIVRTATTWKDGPAYKAARETLIDKYGLSEDSPFVTVFMPGPEEGVYRTAPSGETYYAYPDLNSTLDNFEVTLVQAEENNWTYFGVAEISSKHANGGMQSSSAGITFTTDKDGQILQIMGYPSVESRVFK